MARDNQRPARVANRSRTSFAAITSTTCISIEMFRPPTHRPSCRLLVICCVSLFVLANFLTTSQPTSRQHVAAPQQAPVASSFLFASAHVVLTRDDRGQNLVLTGEDGKKEDGDQLVISGNNMGGDGGQSSNMILQDAANREGDIVMNGRSIIIPGEDGHIVLADSRRNDGDDRGPYRSPPNPFMYWTSYMSQRMFSHRMMPFFG